MNACLHYILLRFYDLFRLTIRAQDLENVTENVKIHQNCAASGSAALRQAFQSGKIIAQVK